MVRFFARAAETFGVSVEGLPGDDRPALPVDVVPVTDHDHEAEVRRRWRDAGAPLDA